MLKDNSFLPQIDFDDKYHNEDYLKKVFAERNQAELEKIKIIHNLTQEQLDLFCDFAALRKEIIDDMQGKIEERKKINPRASEEELKIGAYQEQIEPQVRGTILKMQQKGYATYESGFADFDSQRISFQENYLENFSFPGSLINEFAKNGAEVIVKPNAIELKFLKFKDQEVIRDMWKRIEESLPSLVQPAKPSETNAAKNFREDQKRFQNIV